MNAPRIAAAALPDQKRPDHEQGQDNGNRAPERWQDEEDADYAWWDSDLYEMFNDVASNFGGTIEDNEFWVSSSC